MSAPTTTLPTLAGRDPAVIGITGLAGTGKDTAAQYLRSAYGFEPLAFADPINDMLAVLLDCYGVDYAVLHERHLKEQPMQQIPGNPSPRQLKQVLGDALRAIDPSIWVQALAHRAGVHDWPFGAAVHDRIVITDVRYHNEAALVQRLGGVLLRMHRQQAAPVRAHSSEQHAHQLPAHVEIVNNGHTTHGLHDTLDAIMATAGLEPRP